MAGQASHQRGNGCLRRRVWCQTPQHKPRALPQSQRTGVTSTQLGKVLGSRCQMVNSDGAAAMGPRSRPADAILTFHQAPAPARVDTRASVRCQGKRGHRGRDRTASGRREQPEQTGNRGTRRRSRKSWQANPCAVTAGPGRGPPPRRGSQDGGRGREGLLRVPVTSPSEHATAAAASEHGGPHFPPALTSWVTPSTSVLLPG